VRRKTISICSSELWLYQFAYAAIAESPIHTNSEFEMVLLWFNPERKTALPSTCSGRGGEERRDVRH
jgi:hypothetical protein